MNPLTQAGVIDPTTGMTNVPPKPSSLVDPFSIQTQQAAQGIYGGLEQRQNSVNATPMFKKKCNKKY